LAKIHPNLTYAGQRKEYLFLVKRRSPTFANIKRNLIIIPGRPGAYPHGKEILVRTETVDIEVTASYPMNLEETLEDFSKWIIQEDPQPLIFDNEPNRTYFAFIEGDFLPQIIGNVAYGTITFICPDPYKYGELKPLILPQDTSVVNVDVEGQVETFPTIRATFKRSSEFIALAPDEERLFMIGESPEVEVPVVPYEQLILHDELSTLTPWTAVNSTDLDGGTATMPMEVNGGYRFYVPDYGTGPKWHGAAVKRALPESLQDFLIQAQFTQRSDNIDSLGRVELYLLDVNGDIIGKMQIRDGDFQRYVNTAFVSLGTGLNSRDIILRKDQRLNYFQEGILRIRRVGNKITAQVARIDPVTKKQTYQVSGTFIDVENLYQAQVAQVMINISAYGSNPPSLQYADDLKVWKVNPYQPTEVPMIFEAGDELEIDMNRNKIFKNGLPFMQYLQPGSDFFGLKPGANTLFVQPPDAADIELDYRSRWY
jgi:predicted phage tail component-like protein